MLPGSWGVWIALAAFIAAIGFFIDKYHIGSKTKDRARVASLKK